MVKIREDLRLSPEVFCLVQLKNIYILLTSQVDQLSLTIQNLFKRQDFLEKNSTNPQIATQINIYLNFSSHDLFKSCAF